MRNIHIRQVIYRFFELHSPKEDLNQQLRKIVHVVRNYCNRVLLKDTDNRFSKKGTEGSFYED